MDKLKQWVALTVVGCLAIMAAGWFLVISPKRSEAAELRTQAADQASANRTLETELQVLKAQAADLPKEQAKLAAVAAKIPDNPALPGLVRALLEASSASGVELVSITPGQPVLVAPVAPPVAEAPVDGQAAPDPGAPAVSAPDAAAPGPAGQLANIPVAINVVGDYFEVQQFMDALEQLPRALRVHTLSIAPGASPTAGEGAEVSTTDGRSLTTTVDGFIYMAANRPPATAAAVPGAESAPAEAPAADAAAAETATPAE